MATKDTIEGYFDHLKQMKGWESFLSESMTFISFTSPIKQVRGRDAYIESTKRFYSMITSMQVKDLLVDGEKACALTHYELQPPTAKPLAVMLRRFSPLKTAKSTRLTSTLTTRHSRNRHHYAPLSQRYLSDGSTTGLQYR